MSDTMTPEIIKELNRYYGDDFLSFSERGMTLHYTGGLKEFIEEFDIKTEMDFDSSDLYDRFFLPNGLQEMSFCMNNDRLYPNHFGLTQCPLFSFGGLLYAQDEMPVKYVFMFFNRYQIADWMEELIRYGEVIFETFIDNSEEYNKFYDELVELDIDGRIINA